MTNLADICIDVNGRDEGKIEVRPDVDDTHIDVHSGDGKMHDYSPSPSFPSALLEGNVESTSRAPYWPGFAYPLVGSGRVRYDLFTPPVVLPYMPWNNDGER